jgi:hypothetical protein
MEHLLLNGYDNLSVLGAYDKFLNHYRATFSPDTDELFGTKNPDTAFIALSHYANYAPYQRDLMDSEVLYTEIAGRVAITEETSIAFRMDSILRDKKTGRIFSREHKTGSSLYLWDEQWALDLQPSTYSHVLYCLYPYEKVDQIEINGTFFMKRKKDPIEFHRLNIHKTKDQMNVWLGRIRYLIWDITREYSILTTMSTENDDVLSAFPLRDTNCIYYNKLCPFMDFCLAWPNPLRRAYKPPIGFTRRIWNPLEEEAKITFNLGSR